MSHLVEILDAENWRCDACGVGLEFAKVEVAYRGSRYPVELPRCPQCGIVFIDERLALGKMAEIEKILEDK